MQMPVLRAPMVLVLPDLPCVVLGLGGGVAAGESGRAWPDSCRGVQNILPYEPSLISGVESLIPGVVVGILLLYARNRSSARQPDTNKTPEPSTDTTEPDLEQVLARCSADTPTVGESVAAFRLSQQRIAAGRLLEASALAERALRVARDLPEIRAADLILLVQHHAGLLESIGRVSDAVTVQTQAVEIARTAHFRGSPEALEPVVGLGRILRGSGRYAEAEHQLRNVITALQERELASEPARQQLLCAAYGELARLSLASGRFAEAESALLRKLELERARVGPASPDLAPILEALGEVRTRLGRPEEGRSYLEEALALVESARGPMHAQTGRLVDRLGTWLWEHGELAAAEVAMLRAQSIEEHLQGTAHPDLVGRLRAIAACRRLQGNLVDAEPPLRRAIAMTEERLGKEHLELVGLQTDLASVFITRGFYPDADVLLRSALEIARANTSGPVLCDVLDALARLEQLRGRTAESADLLTEALRWRESALSAEHPEIGFRCAALAALRMELHQIGPSEEMLARSLRILERSLGREHEGLIGVLHMLSGAAWQRGNLDAAARHLERALSVAETALGEDSAALVPLLESQAMVLSRLGRGPEADHNRARAVVLRAGPRTASSLN